MSAPPPYTQAEAPIPTSAASTVSTVSRLFASLKSGTADRENRALGIAGKAFELWPLPPGVSVERIYEGKLLMVLFGLLEEKRLMR